jgi:hypothetical protein
MILGWFNEEKRENFFGLVFSISMVRRRQICKISKQRFLKIILFL